jgi:hypothetical protein
MNKYVICLEENVRIRRGMESAMCIRFGGLLWDHCATLNKRYGTTFTSGTALSASILLYTRQEVDDPEHPGQKITQGSLNSRINGRLGGATVSHETHSRGGTTTLSLYGKQVREAARRAYLQPNEHGVALRRAVSSRTSLGKRKQRGDAENKAEQDDEEREQKKTHVLRRE